MKKKKKKTAIYTIKEKVEKIDRLVLSCDVKITLLRSLPVRALCVIAGSSIRKRCVTFIRIGSGFIAKMTLP